jgi:tRNA acetyltransferase TAN1
MLRDFNLIATTARGNERQMIHEILYLLRDALGDQSAEASKTGVRGLIAAKASLDPIDVIRRFKVILRERPYEFRYALRIVPIQRILDTDLDQIRSIAEDLSSGIGDGESFRVTIEKRFTQLHSIDFIEAVAAGIHKKVDLDNPSKVLLVEVLGKITGLSLIEPDGILNVLKEKML